MFWASLVHRLSRRLDGLSCWTLTLILLGVGVAMRAVLQPWLDPLNFLTFYPALAISALLCGWIPATALLILSVLVVSYFFLEPVGSFFFRDTRTFVDAVGYLAVGGVLILLIAGLVQLVEQLEVAKEAQESLFRELQHRVANNLQIVVAMLRNARRTPLDEGSAEVVMLAEDRITAMSELHRRLYDKSAYDKGIEPILVDALREDFRGLNVRVTLDITKDLVLSLNQMTAIVLLINEAALNAQKHVFQKGAGTIFAVELVKRSDRSLQLTIRDDGPGMNSTPPTRASQSLGMSIMEGFARQLGGTLTVLSTYGMTLSVAFDAN